MREVLDRFDGEREIAYTTVMTVLDRLAKKDLVTRERDGRAWRYFPADTREALTAQTMRRTLVDMDVTDRRTALLHFLDGATSDEIEDLKAALAEVEERAAEGPAAARRPRARCARGCAAAERRHPPPATMGAVIPFVLAALAVLLVWVAPGLMARQRRFRRAPRAALVAWQAATLGGILAAVAVAPATLPLFLDDGEAATARPWWVLAAARRERDRARARAVGRARRRHPCCVGCAANSASSSTSSPPTTAGARVRVLQHPTPTAYCIPGRGSRVVLSQGVLDALPDDQLAAVVAHEDAHLRGRHDLLLEFFSVAHAAVPTRLRSEAAIAEVRLLVEALADRAAARRSGEVATARALVALAGSRTPTAALGAGTTAPVRLRLLADGPRAAGPVRRCLRVCRRGRHPAGAAARRGLDMSVRARLSAALPVAMKARDRVAVAALRSALAAVANAEAVPVDSVPRPAPSRTPPAAPAPPTRRGVS